MLDAKGQEVRTMRDFDTQTVACSTMAETKRFSERLSRWAGAVMIAAMLALSPASAQEVESFDPDAAFEAYQANGQRTVDNNANTGAIDADLVDPALRNSQSSDLPDLPRVDNSGFDGEFADYAQAQTGEPVPQWSEPAPTGQVATAQEASTTYGEDDLIGAAEGVFGKGAEGLAGLIEDLLRKQGEPNGYIIGREGGGAFVFGVRYGSGTLHHKVEGERKVYWTGPSLGFDAGANAGNTFVLVYNLYDTEDIFKRFPAGEGQAYFVGGLHASYMRRGDVVLIPIRVGAGVRLGVNAGYMRFSKKQRWLPF
jgi:hypothetical protein